MFSCSCLVQLPASFLATHRLRLTATFSTAASVSRDRHNWSYDVTFLESNWKHKDKLCAYSNKASIMSVLNYWSCCCVGGSLKPDCPFNLCEHASMLTSSAPESCHDFLRPTCTQQGAEVWSTHTWPQLSQWPSAFGDLNSWRFWVLGEFMPWISETVSNTNRHAFLVLCVIFRFFIWLQLFAKLFIFQSEKRCQTHNWSGSWVRLLLPPEDLRRN